MSFIVFLNCDIHPLSSVGRFAFYFIFFRDADSAPINEVIIVVVVSESCSLNGVNIEKPSGIRKLMNEPGNVTCEVKIPAILEQDLIDYLVNSTEFKAKVLFLTMHSHHSVYFCSVFIYIILATAFALSHLSCVA